MPYLFFGEFDLSGTFWINHRTPQVIMKLNGLYPRIIIVVLFSLTHLN